MSRPVVGIGLVGAGFLAETRARCYRGVAGVEARVVAVYSRSRARAEGFARQHAVPEVHETLAQLLDRSDVQLVDLCVPNRWHRPLCEQAAAAGKHVLCTKPLTAYVGQDLPDDCEDARVSGRDRRTMARVALADAQAMVRATRAAGVQLLYGENWIHAPAVRRAQRLLERSGGVLLEMRGWECHSGSHSPYSKTWRFSGGGALLRLGAHPIGAMLHLKRAEGRARDGRPIPVVSVTADVADLTRNPALTDRNTNVATAYEDVENWGCAILTFADGSRGVCYGSDAVLGGMDSRLELYASNCRFQCNLSPNDLLKSYAPDDAVFKDEVLMEKVDTRAGWNTPIPSEDWSSGQLPMLEEFLGAWAEGRPVDSDGELGADVVRVVYGAYVAAAEGRAVALDEL